MTSGPLGLHYIFPLLYLAFQSFLQLASFQLLSLLPIVSGLTEEASIKVLSAADPKLKDFMYLQGRTALWYNPEYTSH